MSAALKEQVSPSQLIFKKMIDIMTEIGPVSKDQKNTVQNFKFRGIDQFINALHPVLAKNRVIILPKCVSSTQEIREVVRANGKTGVDKHVHLQMEYRFCAEDGSHVVVGPIVGEGLDSGDKATAKALSAAMKYMLIETFCIATEDMSEGDFDSPEMQPRMEVKPTPIRARPEIGREIPDDLEERSALNGELLQLYKPYLMAYPHTIFKTLLYERYRVEETRLMTVEQIKDLIELMEERLARASQDKVNAQSSLHIKKPVEPLATESDIKALFERAKAAGIGLESLTDFINKELGKQKFKAMSISELLIVDDAIRDGKLTGKKESGVKSNAVAAKDLPWNKEDMKTLL